MPDIDKSSCLAEGFYCVGLNLPHSVRQFTTLPHPSLPAYTYLQVSQKLDLRFRSFLSKLTILGMYTALHMGA